MHNSTDREIDYRRYLDLGRAERSKQAHVLLRALSQWARRAFAAGRRRAVAQDGGASARA
jgi:hypothetical protein